MAGTQAKAGPKVALADLGPAPWDSWSGTRADRAQRFIETYCFVPKGHGARKRFKLAPFQVELLRALLDDAPRAAVVSIPRGNGKTTFAAALALYALFADRVEGAQVLVVAVSERQARICFDTAVRIAELEPQLWGRCQHFRSDHRLEVPETGSLMQPLPAEPGALQGYDPSLAVVDEIGFIRPETWEAMIGAAGKRPTSLALGIGTPGYDQGVMWGLRERVLRGDELPGFYWREFCAPETCDAADEEAWRIANPAVEAGFLALDALRTVIVTMPEASFRTLRLGQWVGRENAWLPPGAWDALPQADAPSEGTSVVLGFDGSVSGDATALMGVVPETAQVFTVGLWENPGLDGWRVPRAEVLDVIRLAFAKYDVVEVVFDPWHWRTEFQQLADEYEETPFTEYPTNIVSRMGPATDRFYQAVAEARIAHDHDPVAARHFANCKAKVTSVGAVITKDAKSSPHKIDAAVAAIIAFDVAETREPEPAFSWLAY